MAPAVLGAAHQGRPITPNEKKQITTKMGRLPCIGSKSCLVNDITLFCEFFFISGYRDVIWQGQAQSWQILPFEDS